LIWIIALVLVCGFGFSLIMTALYLREKEE